MALAGRLRPATVTPWQPSGERKPPRRHTVALTPVAAGRATSARRAHGLLAVTPRGVRSEPALCWGRLCEVEVALSAGRAEMRDRTLVDPVGGGDDPALGGLPEYLGQADHRDRTGQNDVGENLPWPAVQLVDITPQSRWRPCRAPP